MYNGITLLYARTVSQLSFSETPKQTHSGTGRAEIGWRLEMPAATGAGEPGRSSVSLSSAFSSPLSAFYLLNRKPAG